GYDKRVVRDARAVEDVVNVSKPSNLWNFLGPYLPDHLVAKREAVLNVSFDELSADQVSFLGDITPDLGVTLEFGAEKNGLYEFDTLSQEGLNELIARFGSAVIVLDLPNSENTD